MQTILRRLSGLVQVSVNWLVLTFFLAALLMGIVERRSHG